MKLEYIRSRRDFLKTGCRALSTAGAAAALSRAGLMTARAQTGGEALYKAKCAGCHGPDGKGETAVGKANKVRDLGSADVQAQSDDAIAEIIGSGKGKMPAYGKSLKAEQIKDLVAYIRSLKK